MATKRYRRPKMEDGDLKMYYGKLPRDQPDVIIDWKGDCGMSRDAKYLHFVLASPRMRQTFAYENSPLPYTFAPSFIEELKTRGYDIETFQFSIKKKQNVG